MNKPHKTYIKEFLRKKNKCLCCGKKLTAAMGRQMYCSNCGLHIKELRMMISYLKSKNEKLRKKMWGYKTATKQWSLKNLCLKNLLNQEKK